MTFAVQCECGATLRVKDSLRGQSRHCPKCTRSIHLAPADEVRARSNISIVTEKTVAPTCQRNRFPAVVAVSTIGVLALVSAGIYLTYSGNQTATNHRAASRNTQSAQQENRQSNGPDLNDATVTPNRNSESQPSSPKFATPREATGIKESVLLAIMNANTGNDARFHHSFKAATVQDDAAPDRVALYKDSNNELYLMLTGSPGDLTLLQLIMPLKEFIAENDGEATGEGAAAFGRCVQRMAAAADPSWTADLYSWMNKNMAQGLILPEGVTTSKKHLMARFSTFKTKQNDMMVTMTIGIPARSQTE